jgi:hypothetical protein
MASAASGDAFDSPRPDLDDLRFVLLKLLCELIRVVRLGVDREALNFDAVFDDDLVILGKGICGRKESDIGAWFESFVTSIVTRSPFALASCSVGADGKILRPRGR